MNEGATKGTRRASRWTPSALGVALCLGCAATSDPSRTDAHTFELVIANGRVMDPESGLDAVRHIGIEGGKIVAIREHELVGAHTLDATDRVVAPGFIDLNTYQHGDPLFRLRAADGVTAVLNMEGGAADVAAYYDALEGRALIHYGTAFDHGSARHLAQGDAAIELVGGVNEERGDPELDLRALVDDELDALVARAERGLRDGAVAIGFGVEYTPGATQSEVLRLIELAAHHDASAHLHVREFDRTRDWSQIYEVLGVAIRTGADVHVNHLNSIFESHSDQALEFLRCARALGISVTTECYPYTAGMTFIESALFDDWQTWSDERLQRCEWPPTGERLTRETFARFRGEGGVLVLHPRDEPAQERAVRTCVADALPMIASDGAWDDGRTHPRSAGTNSRVLGRYVREQRALTLMDALRKMSLAPARHLERRVPAMRDKGRVRVGADADLVVFDPATVIDRATYQECTLPPAGIDAVIVLGVPVVLDGVVQDALHPGRPIRGPRSLR